MTAPAKPLPELGDPLTGPHWSALKESRLVIQQCANCSYLRWPPAPVCPECQSAAATWEKVTPRGELWSYATYYRALDRAFEDELPYTVGLIQLDSGPRMLGKLLDPIEDIEIGLHAEGVFEQVTPEVTMLRWKLADRD